MNVFKYGSYSYEYELKRENRKTLNLTVKPDLRIILKSPINASEKRIEIFLKRKWNWLEKQLSYFKKYKKPLIKREFISGESIWFLGRQYKILVKSSTENSIKVEKNILYIYTDVSTKVGINNRLILKKWLRKKTKEIFNERLVEMQNRFDYNQMPKLSIRKMDKRWGSFLNREKIVLNPNLIHTSTDCIDYVIVHELCHMKYKNHSRKFFEYLSEQYPNWKKIKDKLEMSIIL